MDILIGASSSAQGELAQKVIRDLSFTNPHLHFANVLEPWIDPGLGTTPFPIQTYYEAMQAESHGILELMQRTAEDHGFTNSETKQLFGDVGNELLNHADQIKADLLVIGSFEKGKLETALLGSVGRKALVNAHQSVLIVKETYRAEGGLHVVIATDHSPYSRRCLDQLLSWRPLGIKRVTLVTVIPKEMQEHLEKKSPHFNADAVRLMTEGLARENAKLIHSLSVWDVPCDNRVESGEISTTLSRVMRQTGADLLILGSQGHGFLERMSIGSISLDQATREDYSILVLRI